MERRKAVPAALGRNLVSDLARGLEVVATLDQLDAECAHRGVLVDAVAERNDDNGRQLELAGGEPDGLTMVPAGRRDDTGRAGTVAPKFVHVDETAAHLEGAGRCMVFVLDPHRGADPLIEEWPPVLWRRRHRSVNQGRSGLQVLERNGLGRARSG